MSPKGGQKIQPTGRTIQEEKTAGRTIQQKGACWANHTDEKLNLNASGKFVLQVLLPTPRGSCNGRRVKCNLEGPRSRPLFSEEKPRYR